MNQYSPQLAIFYVGFQFVRPKASQSDFVCFFRDIRNLDAMKVTRSTSTCWQSTDMYVISYQYIIEMNRKIAPQSAAPHTPRPGSILLVYSHVSTPFSLGHLPV